MAIDTAGKRRAVSGVGRKWRGPGLIPDAIKGLFWRQSAGRGYGGIPSGEPEDIVAPPSRTFSPQAIPSRLCVVPVFQNRQSTPTTLPSRTFTPIG